MIKYDEKHSIGCCTRCGAIAEYLNGDVLEEDMWQAYRCEKCNITFSERYEVKYIGYVTYED